MNRDLFLAQLERLLYEIPREERDEAMDYYRSYFEDAGAENEAVVLEELESPQKIADSIIEALNSTGDMKGALKNPPQVREGQTQSGKYGYQKSGSGHGYKSIFSGSDFHRGQMRAPKVIPGRKTHQGQITNGMISMEAKAGRVMGIQTGDQR